MADAHDDPNDDVVDEPVADEDLVDQDLLVEVSEPEPGSPLLRRLGWEAFLLVAVLVGFGAAARHVPLLSEGDLLWRVTYLGLLASGLALSLRAAAPNLAVAGLAGGATLVYADLVVNAEWPPTVAALLVMVLAALAGVLMWLVSDVLSAPAWAVSLAALPAIATVLSRLGDLPYEYYSGDPMITGFALAQPGLWFVLFLVVSVGGGACLALPAVRRHLEAGRSDDGWLQPWLVRLIGFTGSSLLGGLAGLVGVLYTGTVPVGMSFAGFPTFNLSDLYLVLGAVLLGGVAIRGHQGGVAGTALATILLVGTVVWLDLDGAHASAIWSVVTVALLAGFSVSRWLAADAEARTGLPTGA